MFLPSAAAVTGAAAVVVTDVEEDEADGAGACRVCVQTALDPGCPGEPKTHREHRAVSGDPDDRVRH